MKNFLFGIFFALFIFPIAIIIDFIIEEKKQNDNYLHRPNRKLQNRRHDAGAV
jgi:hypothetical protein